MDSFVEQIVLCKKTSKQWMVMLGTALLAAVVLALSFYFLGFFFVIIFVGVMYGVWWIWTSQNIEYEYCITNGDVDIDQIIARRKRKRVVSVSGQKIQTAGKYDKAYWENRKVDRVVMAAPAPEEDGNYCFTYHSKKNGTTLVVFQPDDRVKAAFYKSLPRLIQLDWDKQENQ